ncbi:hypothetical protein EVU94_03560 [Flavobacteriaceae bacterium 144Ye]|nr:hypothetical protein EVU94_03560 [Flavobacteriaceae bacterium 144Ye]
MNKKIKYIRKAPIMKLVLGVTLFCFGIYGFIFNNYFNLILSGIGVFLMLREGSEINLANKTYRQLYSAMGIDIGKWKPLPDIEYVSVFKTKENKRVQGMGASAVWENQIIKLNLFYNSNKKIEAYITTDKDDAFEVAKHLAEVLQIDILDATENESKWL